MDMSNRPVAACNEEQVSLPISWLFENIADPDPDWAVKNPERAMALLFVSPRPCDALDAVMGL